MRYEPDDHEWAAIRPMLPNKPLAAAVPARTVLTRFPRSRAMYVAKTSCAGVPWRLAVGTGSVPAPMLSRATLAASRASATVRIGYRPGIVSLRVRTWGSRGLV
jgi:hypothetical protein